MKRLYIINIQHVLVSFSINVKQIFSVFPYLLFLNIYIYIYLFYFLLLLFIYFFIIIIISVIIIIIIVVVIINGSVFFSFSLYMNI